MCFSELPPGGQSDEHEPTATEEIKDKLDAVLEAGREQLVATTEMRAALAHIRRRIDASVPIILPRPTPEIPRAQKRRRPTP